MRGILVFSHCILYFLIKKLLERVFTRSNEWEAPTPLRRRERDFPVVKSVHVSYHWMRNHALFHMERRVMTYHGWIAVGNRSFEFFFILFSFLPTKLQYCLFCCCLLGLISFARFKSLGRDMTTRSNLFGPINLKYFYTFNIFIIFFKN